MACDQCQNGWVFVERSAVSGWARREMSRSFSGEEAEFEASLMAMAFSLLLADGWGIEQVSGAERCPCSLPVQKSVLKPSLEKINKVVRALSNLIPFFPQDPVSLNLITAEINNFCRDEEELEVFARHAMRYFTKWQGVGPLRALYCSLYTPADGVYAKVTFQDAEGRTQLGLPGYTEPELIASYVAQDRSERMFRDEQYKRLALDAPDSEPFLLPEVKRIA